MQRKPTPVQRFMLVLMGIIFGVGLIWLIPELIGVISPAANDTWSEYVWGLPLGWVLAIAAVHVLAGVALIWSAGHFIEGWRRRHGKERR